MHHWNSTLSSRRRPNHHRCDRHPPSRVPVNDPIICGPGVAGERGVGRRPLRPLHADHAAADARAEVSRFESLWLRLPVGGAGQTGGLDRVRYDWGHLYLTGERTWTSQTAPPWPTRSCRSFRNSYRFLCRDTRWTARCETPPDRNPGTPTPDRTPQRPHWCAVGGGQVNEASDRNMRNWGRWASFRPNLPK